MARITVEDCIKKINNRFELIMTASQRSRSMSSGEKPLLDRDNDKNTVLSLREIAEDMIAKDEMEEAIIKRMQKAKKFDDKTEETIAEEIESSTALSEEIKDIENPFTPASKKDSFSTGMEANANDFKFEDVNPDEIED